MRFVVWVALTVVFLGAGCSRQPATKFKLEGFHVDMPLSDLQQERDWIPGGLKGWDLQSPGELNGAAGTFYANEHNGVVTRVKFLAEADTKDAQADLKTTAQNVLVGFEERYGKSTFPHVHNKNPNVDRIEWLDTDYDLVMTIRDADFQVEIRNKLARSIELRDEKATRVN